MSDLFRQKDNEFVAWYPNRLDAQTAGTTWRKRRAGYYVHIPFCTAICDYCGFAIEQSKGANVRRYLDALEREILRYADEHRLAQHRLVCGHFGGGTPSVIEAEDLVHMKRLIDKRFDVAPDAEITVEVNPISFTLEKAKAYHAAGVNRVSCGVQSFNERSLRTIGRPHRGADVREALDVIRQVGWTNFSLDIMYGIPGQTLDELRDDLRRAVDTGAAHLSAFRVEIIPFTALKLREAAGLVPPRQRRAALDAMDELVTEVLTSSGYREYGAFNYALPGYESMHNEIAFVAPQGEYVGFGNSSYSYMNGHVYCNHADLPSYEAAVLAGRDPIVLAKRVTALEQMSRYFVLGLKFLRVSRRPFIERYGVEPEHLFGDTITRLINHGLLVREEDDYVLTRVGRYYVNNVVKEFYTSENHGVRQHLQFVPTLSPDKILHYAETFRKREQGTAPAEE